VSAVLHGRRAGTPSVEMAMTMPALILVTIGVMQLGIAFLANSGIRNGVESGARFSSVLSDPTAPTTYPTDSAIWSNVTSHLFGVNALGTATSTSNPAECGTNTGTKFSGTVAGTSDAYSGIVCRGTSNGQAFVDVTLKYPLRMNFIVINTPMMTLSYTRRAYRL